MQSLAQRAKQPFTIFFLSTLLIMGLGLGFSLHAQNHLPTGPAQAPADLVADPVPLHSWEAVAAGSWLAVAGV